MRTLRQRLAAVTLLGGLTVLGTGLAAGPASAAVDDCIGYLGSAQSGSLQLTSTPAAGSAVAVGTPIAFEASWDDADFRETGRFYLCGSVGGAFAEALSSQHNPLDNTGDFSAAVTVPGSLPVDSDVCFVGVVKGQLAAGVSGTMVSDPVCFASAAAATTTTTSSTTTTTTTRLAEPNVEPAVVEAGAPAPVLAMAPAVEPATLAELPRTGRSIGLLAGLGAVTLAVGGATRLIARRRPAEG